MDERDLFAAIGGVDEDLLIEAPRRLLPRRLGLIAAVLVMVVLTACAPVVVRTFKALAGGDAEQTRELAREGSVIFDPETGDIVAMGEMNMIPAEYEIMLDIPVEGSRPHTLKELYTPGWIPEDYGRHFDESEENCRILRYATGSRNGLIGRYIEFRQSLLPEGNPVTVTDTFGGFRGLHLNDMVSEYVTYGEAAVLELRAEMDVLEAEVYSSSFMQVSRYLYWSDGAYLFRLEIPYEMDDETVTRIIASIGA